MGNLEKVVLNLEGQTQWLHHPGEIIRFFRRRPSQQCPDHTRCLKGVPRRLQEIGQLNLVTGDAPDIPRA